MVKNEMLLFRESRGVTPAGQRMSVEKKAKISLEKKRVQSLVHSECQGQPYGLYMSTMRELIPSALSVL
jgi:hypothetical protein